MSRGPCCCVPQLKSRRERGRRTEEERQEADLNMAVTVGALAIAKRARQHGAWKLRRFSHIGWILYGQISLGHWFASPAVFEPNKAAIKVHVKTTAAAKGWGILPANTLLRQSSSCRGVALVNFPTVSSPRLCSIFVAALCLSIVGCSANAPSTSSIAGGQL